MCPASKRKQKGGKVRWKKCPRAPKLADACITGNSDVAGMVVIEGKSRNGTTWYSYLVGPVYTHILVACKQ